MNYSFLKIYYESLEQIFINNNIIKLLIFKIKNNMIISRAWQS